MILAVLPIIIPLAAACLTILVPGRRIAQRVVSLVSTTTLLAVAIALLQEVRQAGIVTHHLGEWPAPFGIVFVVDVFSALMVLVAAIIGLATSIYSLADADAGRERWGYHALTQILLMGVCGAFLTGDLFNLYVWFEVLLIASFVLLAMGGTRFQMEAAIKYVTINLVASAVFLAALGILYGLVGTVNMADLSVKLADTDRPGLVTAVAMLFLVAFGIKAAVFPLFFWLPSSYHTPAAAVSAIFAGLLTKVGVYALIRTFTLIFTQDVGYTHGLLLWVGVLTMVTGVLGAMAQDEIRRVLSFHIISQIGYMVLGLALYTPLAIAGAVFYIFHHILVKANLFFVGGIVRHMHGSYALARLGGLARSAPLLALLFLVPALSLAGVPPLSGFWAKFLVIRAGLEAEAYVAVAAALAVGLLTLYSMTKIWSEVFWKAAPADMPPPALQTGSRIAMMLPVALLCVLTLSIGLAPGILMDLAQQAGTQLTGPEAYVQAVGVRP